VSWAEAREDARRSKEKRRRTDAVQDLAELARFGESSGSDIVIVRWG
jgi:hypothetical protein